MKKLFFFFIFLFLIPFVSAYYGGEDILLKHFDKCDNLDVIVIGDQEINEGEYFLNKNCEKVDCESINDEEVNKKECWSCICVDNYDLILHTSLGTINDYVITISYTLESEGVDSSIKVNGDDLTLDEVSYENGILTLKITSSGTKTITIDVSLLGKPNYLYVDDVLKIDGIDWTYDNGIITITLTFSTRTLELDYNVPVGYGGGPSGGGSPRGGNVPINSPVEEVKTSKLECAPGYTLSERQECIETKTQEKEEIKETINVESNPITGNVMLDFVKENKIGTVITLVIVALLLILYIYLKLRKKE